MSAARAVVVGGGLAGTAAALDLADRGWQVQVLESRSRLGGAAYSFDRDGLPVDTGQHVLLRCYREYLGLLGRLGVEHLVSVQARMDIPVLRPGRSPVRLRRARALPAPLHLLPTLLGYQPLPARERLSVVRAMAALRTVDPDDPATDRVCFGDWLHQHGQQDRAASALWGLVTVAALNIAVADASLALVARVFRTGLLEQSDAGDIATLGAALSTIHDDATRRAFGRSGVELRTRERVARVDRDGDGYVVRTADGEVEADAVVVAVPHRQAAGILPGEACPDRERWAGLGSSPIVNVHVRYDRAVMPVRFAAALNSPVQWLFDRTPVAGCDGQYLALSQSAADDLVGQSAEEVLRTHVRALEQLLPAARSAQVVDSFVTREPHATFRQQAGSAGLRPAAATRWPGVALAGAWTATGWPDTLEGAVRSGREGARVAASRPTPLTAHQRSATR
jgi:squalene-associated FAD-dependent desaturase